MSLPELPTEHEGPRVFVVVADLGDLDPYAAVFWTREEAEAFQREHHGFEIIDTAVSRHSRQLSEAG